MGVRGLGSPAPKMWHKNHPFCVQCLPLYISLIFRLIGAIFSLSGRRHPAFCNAPSRSRFALTVFGSVPKNKITLPPILQLFTRGNALFFSPHGRPCRGPGHAPSRSHFVLMVFGLMPKNEHYIIVDVAVVFTR